ncbi:hypothetical protein [Vulgatibacter incomptus]|uniref:Lipoprotein n=1 Tax=Vulgatibacter incomptus TaxID=1391653 RepID=A0A0K1PD49_9BACT|nr:hypothetical protein [Vulgatibacter incomptus]AKU91427.1 hypothetical protein AKJ08_1814 [Vulgatibacter incomptus]
MNTSPSNRAALLKTTLFAALLVVALPACMVDVHGPRGGGGGGGGGTQPRPDRPTPSPLQWGEACGSTPQCASGLNCLDGTCEPARIGIYPVSALVGPGLTDGREWKSDRFLPRWVWDELASARRRGVSSLYAFMADQARLGWSRPNPYGYGFLSTDGYRYDDRYTIALAERGYNELQTFTPSWSGGVGWTQVPFTERLSVALDVWDEDRWDDQSIGFVELDFPLLREALYQGGVTYFDTYDATGGQLLLVGVQVVAER